MLVSYTGSKFPCCLEHRKLSYRQRIPVAARSEAWVCGCSYGGIARSNPAGGMDVYLL
jgi:hypothetical protein